MSPVTGESGLIQPGSRDSAAVIHEHLRARILSGDLAPNSHLSQAQVAQELGVSRGPVREAFRMLEQEHLIVSEVNHRARVTELSVENIEYLYALRVVNEALAISASVAQFNDDELDELDDLATQVADPRAVGFDAWEVQHEKFHSMLLRHSGDHMVATAAQLASHTHRYRRVYVNDERGGWTLGAMEHSLLVKLCRERDPDAAADLLARHLSRAALTLLSSMAPAYEPTLLRAAIRQVTGPPDGA